MKIFTFIILAVFFSVGTIISGLTSQATAAEIDVQRPAGTSIPDGGSDNVGNPIVGLVSLIYTIDNTAGTDTLNIVSLVFSNIVNVSGFSVGWPGPVPAGGTGALGIAFNVDSAGVFSFDMQISSNDADENPYNISVSGTGIALRPEIDVQRPAGTSIPDEGIDNAGNPGIGPVSLIYTIDNTAGTDTLNIVSLVISNFVNVSGFTVGMPGNVPAGGTGAMGIAFNVDSAGVFSFDMQISSNDADENPYNIRVLGGPTEIDVLGNDNSIANGDSSPSVADDTDFGSTEVNGGVADRTFTIENIGGFNLNLPGGPPCVTVTGSHFSLLYDAVTPVVGGTSTTFTVRFDPSAPGLHSAIVSIENDDSDEDPYEFTIQGSGTEVSDTEVSDTDPVFDRSGGGCFIESLIDF